MNTDTEVVEQAIEEVQVVEVKQALSIREKLLRVGLSLVLFVLLFSSLLLSDKLRTILLAQTPIRDLFPGLLVPSPYPTSVPSPVPTPSPYYVLMHQLKDSVATIAALPQDSQHVAYWQNYLFFPQKTASGSTDIIALNIQTNEKQTIFTKDKEFGLESLDVYENSLLFSFGRYFGGYQYRVNLSKGFQAEQIGEVISGSFAPDWHGRTWLVGGFGDGCAGRADFYIVDRNSWKSELITSVNQTCENGEMVIGIDKRDRILIGGFVDEDMKFSYITSRFVTNPTIEEGIISKEEMPKEIKKVEYDPEANRIVMSTDTKSYIHLLNTKETTESATLVTNFVADQPYPHENQGITEKIEQMDLPDGYYWEVQQH